MLARALHLSLNQQFHLDEPWDSEHNLTLVPQMPEVYRSNFACKHKRFTGAFVSLLHRNIHHKTDSGVG